MTKTFRIEKDVKKEINRLLDKHGWFWWNIPANGYGSSGVSDKQAIKDGVFMAIEAKLYPNKPTDLQRAFLNSIRAEQGFAFVVNDKNMGWFAVFLLAFDRAVISAQNKTIPDTEDGAAMINAMRELQVGL